MAPQLRQGRMGIRAPLRPHLCSCQARSPSNRCSAVIRSRGRGRGGGTGGGLLPPYEGCKARAVVGSAFLEAAHCSLSHDFSGSDTSSAVTQTSLWAPNHITWGLEGQGDPTQNNACVLDTGVSRPPASRVPTQPGLGAVDRVRPGPRLRGTAGEAGTDGPMGRGALSPGGLSRPCPARTEPRALLPAPRGPPRPLSCSAGVAAAPHGETGKAES